MVRPFCQPDKLISTRSSPALRNTQDACRAVDLNLLVKTPSVLSPSLKTFVDLSIRYQCSFDDFSFLKSERIEQWEFMYIYNIEAL